MRTIIAGSRSILDEQAIFTCMFQAWSDGLDTTEIVTGGAIGVDTIAEKIAKERGLPVRTFRPDYNAAIKPRLAPLIRNTEMADYADALIAIWDGKSNGTLHMINEAHKKGLEIFVYTIKSD
jgi:hypothetical protein